ncbi:electron transfer flavoprotein subunit alpha/FixB family protein [Gynuella sunshinyii]|uniref:Electron transfer flavoprotein, alpha subunit n=1 Tax=Gynuella sunshinyii YC6258 TaxID=1445510 RepID=A0A0C5V1R0_9GAMM|nr:electron transfer flavoprotein subunit alpha/FixB family protein [Gynuella sunshinyii]AJQ93490.1 electron transfer flavoprotein, alpha subunit [Gynuella sunshinyii YC6258]
MSQINRRDPRIEKILRNRLHPQHQMVMQKTIGSVTLSVDPKRKNPHVKGFIGPNGIRRINRQLGHNVQHEASKHTYEQSVNLPLITIDQPDHFVAVVPDMVGGRLTAHDKDLLGLARQFVSGHNGAVIAIVFGHCREHQFDLAGVDRLIHFNDEHYQGYCPETKIAALMAVEKRWSPAFWFFPDSIHGGTELGSRLSARLGVRAATRVRQADRTTVTCLGGNQMIDIQRPIEKILLLMEECAEPVSGQRHEARPMLPDIIDTHSPRLQDLGQVQVDPGDIALAEAEFIIAGGNGIRDWDLFHRTATVLHATEGASRVAVDNGHMPRFRQVGATGTWVAAKVYLAVGISGAIQHLQGIGQCNKVIAINTDPDCDMVKRADLSIIDDSQTILTALIDAMQSRNPGDHEDVA